jgi:hypothetical protein
LERERAKGVHDTSTRLTEGKLVSTVILQNIEKVLANIKKGEYQVNMEFCASTGDIWGFMNTSIEIRSTPEVELSQTPNWANCEEYTTESGVTFTQRVAFGKEERPKASPVEISQARVRQSKFNRQPTSNTKRMIRRQAILNSGATSTLTRPQD